MRGFQEQSGGIQHQFHLPVTQRAIADKLDDVVGKRRLAQSAEILYDALCGEADADSRVQGVGSEAVLVHVLRAAHGLRDRDEQVVRGFVHRAPGFEQHLVKQGSSESIGIC